MAQTTTQLTDSLVKRIFDYAIEKGASDIHCKADITPIVRIDSRLFTIPEMTSLSAAASRKIIETIMTPQQNTLLREKRELDFSFGYGNTRFRVNVYYEKGQLAAALRLIPKQIRNFSELGIPPIIEKFTQQAQGLFIITGPTGHGKSTTLAAMVDHVNTTRSEHIITIENPI
ncbi:Flp pilus assembly complex ATPase component TadA, partial [Candidatus Berkelbacteria bacterium]|nr:Flp pilus assembly complex ATPase component TadA [Candidatus Berkelbacteria bacterium]